MSRQSNFKRAAGKKRQAKTEVRFTVKRLEREAWEGGATEREAQNVERLQRDAVLLLVGDGGPLAGVIPNGSDWEVIVRNGLTHQETPFDDRVDAVLQLYEELMLVKLRVHVRGMGQTSDIAITPPDDLKIVQHNEAAAFLLDETRRVLNAEFHSDQLTDEVLELFYEHFADEPARTAIEDRWANEGEAYE